MTTKRDRDDQLRIVAFCDYLAEPMAGGSERVTAEVFGRIGAGGGASVTAVTGISVSKRHLWDLDGVDVVGSRGLDLSPIVGAQLLFAPLLPMKGFLAVRRVRPHVIHGSSIHFFGTVVAAFVSVMSRVPLVVTSHLSGLDALPAPTRIATRLYERTFGRFILARARRVIAVSEAVRDHLLEIGVDAAKIDVIDNGVDSQRYRPAAAIRTDDPYGDDDHVCVAVVGRFVANKGTIEVTEALEHVGARVRVSFAGTGPLERALLKVAMRDDRVVVLGRRDDIEVLLGASDIFLRYSTTEGRSLALLEAMSAGCAVIVSDIAANVAVVDHMRTGLVVGLGDPVALGSAIDLLAGDEALRKRLGDAARAEVAGSGWDEVAERTRKVMADVADGS